MIDLYKYGLSASITASGHTHLKLIRGLVDMGSFARAVTFLVLLQIAMLVFSAVIMSGSVVAARVIDG